MAELNLDDDKLEEIIGVAIKYGDLIIALPKPNRHSDLIRYMIHELQVSEIPKHVNEGFYTAKGTFLRRERAARIAHMTGQCKKPKGSKLTSEDLW